MEVSIITVGDELLAGDTVNSNATWLADRVEARGATVERILALPDDREVIAERVAAYNDAFDAVIVTGGTGGTPDDITMEAVSDAFDREMVVREPVLETIEEKVRRYQEARPELELDIDVEAEASLPAESRPLSNPEGLAPGCVIDNVYVMPGIPDELKAMFETVDEAFDGDSRSQFLYTVEPEGNIVWELDEVQSKFDVSVGCYPDRDEGHNRLKITATDQEELDGAAAWLLDEIDASEEKVTRDWS
jgi:molybdenum cofactor synthesis domain-containing protein